MPILSEQERLIAQESNLIDDSTQYSAPSSWGTIHDYGNVTLGSAGILLIKFDYRCDAYNINDHIWLRVKVGARAKETGE